MRYLLLSLILLVSLNAVSTNSKIKKSKKNLKIEKSIKSKTNRKLSRVAKDIEESKKNILSLEKKIAQLENEQDAREEKFKAFQVRLKKSQDNLDKTSQDLLDKNRVFLSLVSKRFSIVFAMDQFHAPTRKSIISHEVYNAYKKQNVHSLDSLKSDIISLKRTKRANIALRKKIKRDINKIIQKRKMYKAKRVREEKLYKRLSYDEKKYNDKLEKIENRENSLRNTLSKLNILHKREVLDAKKRALERIKARKAEKQRKQRIRREKANARREARRAKLAAIKARKALKKAKTAKARKKARAKAKRLARIAKAKAKKTKKVYKRSKRVRKVNSSYRKPKMFRYRGNKTISPVRGATIIKKFGTYIDPIYKMKIFNEGITLRSKSRNAKVVNVLDGKVVFAGKSSMLGRVVVIAHRNRLHTVYAGLSQIPRTVSKGKKLKKGYVIGKINRKLIFQATKNSKHINPLKLIRL